VFRACYRRFRECVLNRPHAATMSFEFSSGPQGRGMYSRKGEEYAADFCLVSRRLLTEEEHRLFKYFYLLRASPLLCSRELLVPRGHLFHLIYTIQCKLGRGFAELQPYPLYPLDEYFGGTVRCGPARAFEPLCLKRKRRRRKPKTPPPSLPLSA
jgi:hypothetical protein